VMRSKGLRCRAVTRSLRLDRARAEIAPTGARSLEANAGAIPEAGSSFGNASRFGAQSALKPFWARSGSLNSKDLRHQ
jgi:hypothetical protein